MLSGCQSVSVLVSQSVSLSQPVRLAASACLPIHQFIHQPVSVCLPRDLSALFLHWSACLHNCSFLHQSDLLPDLSRTCMLSDCLTGGCVLNVFLYRARSVLSISMSSVYTYLLLVTAQNTLNHITTCLTAQHIIIKSSLSTHNNYLNRHTHTHTHTLARQLHINVYDM